MGLFDFIRKKRAEENIEAVKATPARTAIDDFFSIDIRQLNNYTQNAVNMGKYSISAVPLPLDLGLFDSATIRKFDDGSFNIEFIGNKGVITADLSEFISLCVKQLGPDKSGATYLTEKDFRLLDMGAFSRMWDNVWVDMQTNEQEEKIICITIFNPKQF